MKLLCVALTSLALVALELVWTRLFSAEFFYTFAFLTLSMAVMGLGLGALALRFVPALGGDRALPVVLSLAAVAALGGPPAVFALDLDFSVLFASRAMILRFVAAVALLGAAFFFGGMALAAIFKRNSTEMPRLYMADLAGAGVGVIGAVAAMNAIGTPPAAAWLALPLVVAALLVARGRVRAIPVVVMIALVAFAGRAGGMLEAQREERAPVIYKHWDAMAKIKMFDYGGEARGINIDNVANTPVLGFDGDFTPLEQAPVGSLWDVDVGWLVRRFDRCRFLSLGAGGGSDVLQALGHGAAEVTAVEVIPQINRMMLAGDPAGYTVRDSSTVDSTGAIVTCAEFSGRLYHDRRVRVVTGDARSYVRAHPASFDVIFSLSSNTWAALGSGAFALAENYLFTTEAFRDYWNALSDDGFMSLEHQVYMPRLVSEALDAIASTGVANPRDHIAVYNLPKLRRNVILISKRPLTDEIRNLAYGALEPGRRQPMHLLYPAPDSVSGNLIDAIVTAGWRAVADTARIDVSPATDDRPFIAQMGRWRNLTRDKLEKVQGYADFMGVPISKLIIVIVLAVAVVLLLPLTVLPYAVSRVKLPAAAWWYFLLIGVGFMAVEVVLIQKYTLFIGASVYSLATVLFTLLIAAGIGSRFAARVPPRVVFGGVVGWLLLDALLFPAVTTWLAPLAVPARMAITAILIAPLGFFMGMPFPRAVLRVGPLVDWGFAVNGAGSVLGATAVVLFAFSFGFRAALLASAAVYLTAFGLLAAERAWHVVREEEPVLGTDAAVIVPAAGSQV